MSATALLTISQLRSKADVVVSVADMSFLRLLKVESGKEYEIAVAVVQDLNETEARWLWLAQAHVAAEVFQRLIGQLGAGGVESTEIGVPMTAALMS